jgi:hypothetical protein
MTRSAQRRLRRSGRVTLLIESVAAGTRPVVRRFVVLGVVPRCLGQS